MSDEVEPVATDVAASELTIAPPAIVEPVAEPTPEPEPSGPYVWHEEGHKVYVSDEDAASEGWPRLRQVHGVRGGLYHQVGERLVEGVVHRVYREEP